VLLPTTDAQIDSDVWLMLLFIMQTLHILICN